MFGKAIMVAVTSMDGSLIPLIVNECVRDNEILIALNFIIL